MNDYPPLEVKVWGDFACFTRPDMKVERVSYPVITPSAARGVLEAIFWKPEFSWRVREIQVLKPINHFSILRNEVKSKVQKTIMSWEKKDGRYFADEDRTQRHSLLLRDVEYIIKADIVLNSHATDDQAKYRDQFRRRVSKGQCYQRPYLGCREFSADFCEPDGSEKSLDYTSDLGLILFDLDYDEKKGGGKPVFFRGRIENGIFRIPPELYKKKGEAA
jgi:CRISPR-associated protein Cas5d